MKIPSRRTIATVDVNSLKKRYEKLSSQPQLVDPFKETLRSINERPDLTSRQSYNADENGRARLEKTAPDNNE